MELPWVLLALAGMDAASGLALLPYVPRVAPGAMPGKVTATTFVLERPHCIFDPLANASDAVWLAVAFADGERVPLYEGLPTARAYMTLEMAAAAYGCSAPGAAVLRVGGDTACHGRAPCNGPLPSPGPYRVKFLLMGCNGPKAETKWSDPILLRRGTGGSGAATSVPPPQNQRGEDTAVIIAAILASLGAVLAMAMLGAVGYEWGTGILRLFFSQIGGLLYFGNGMGWFLPCLSCMDPA
uniref:Uroplakin 3B n=1 Tax=Pavo cristatus TaxID=9049 RepID=A0A8C9F5M4_PAVCR